MNETDLNRIIEGTLEEFESSGGLNMTREWRDSLEARLGEKPGNTLVSGFTPRVIIVTVIIAIMNIGFLLSVLLKNNVQDSDRQSDLKLISKELLINPDNLK